MSFSNQQNPNYPSVPSSLNAGEYEMRDYASDQTDLKAGAPSTDPDLTPYLGLRARLSQVWINRWTILLALVLARVILAVQGLNGDIASAKKEALSACTSVESVGSAMASMPHYLSAGVNEMAADGVTNAVNGLMDMLMLTVTGVEEIILFVINMMTSTYVCLATVLIDGTLEVSIELMQDVANDMQNTINGLADDIAGGVTDFQDAMNSFLKDLGDVAGLFGGTTTPPQINLTSEVDSLHNVNVDFSQFDKDLTKLNSSLPTFAQVQNFTNGVIRLPFEEVKKLINESVAAYSFDKSVFPLADKQQLTFCSDNSAINDFFGGLTKIANDARKIFIVVLTLAAILVCIPMAYAEIRRWRTMKQRSLLLQKQVFDPLDVMYIASRPYTSTMGIKLASKFTSSSRRQILVRWIVAYGTSMPALFVLSLGVAGLLACLCQYILLRALVREVPVLASEVGDFAGTVVASLNNASTAWAVAANSVINATNARVNDDVFGWVNTSTSAVNDTLNAFVDEMNDALNATFGGTVLYAPVTDVMNCLVGLKVAGVERALTWVADNAHVSFPEFRNDTFSLGAAQSISNSSSGLDSFLASPDDAATDSVTGAVVALAAGLERVIRQEAVISGTVVLLYVLIVLGGAARAMLLLLCHREKTRAEGGPAGYTGGGGGGAAARTVGSGGPAPVILAAEAAFPSFGSVDAPAAYPGVGRGVDAYAAGGGGQGGGGGLSLRDEKSGHFGDAGRDTITTTREYARESSFEWDGGNEKH